MRCSERYEFSYVNLAYRSFQTTDTLLKMLVCIIKVIFEISDIEEFLIFL